MLSFQPLPVDAAAADAVATTADINYHHRIVCSWSSSFDTFIRSAVHRSVFSLCGVVVWISYCHSKRHLPNNNVGMCVRPCVTAWEADDSLGPVASGVAEFANRSTTAIGTQAECERGGGKNRLDCAEMQLDGWEMRDAEAESKKIKQLIRKFIRTYTSMQSVRMY